MSNIKNASLSRRSFVSVASAACGLALASTVGCSSPNNTTDEKPKEDGAKAAQGDAPQTNEAKNKDSLTIYVGEEPEDGFDPLSSYWGTNGAYALFQSRLLAFDKDLKIVPDLAEKFEKSEDGLTYTYTLKDGLKFSDGSDVTADDVVFSYLTIRDNGAGHIDFQLLEDAKALDPKTIEFKLKQKDSSFVARTAKLCIVPKAGYNPQQYRVKPMGSGPFKLVQYEPGQQLIIEPNEYYYGTKSPFKRITLLFINGETALAHAQAGELDVAMVQPEYAKEHVEGMKLETLPTIDTRGFNLPTIKPQEIDGKTRGNDVTVDPAIRKALSIGINRQEIVDHALNGIGTPHSALLHSVPWANPESEFKDDRLDEAKKILDDAGWVAGSDGIRVKDGLKAEFTITGRADDIQRHNLAVALSEQAKKLGINIIAKSAAWKECRGNAGAEPTCWGTGDYDPSADLMGYYHSTGAINESRYSNPKVDDYAKQALEADGDEINKLWQKMQWDGTTGPESENGEHPYIWLATIDHTYFVNENLDICAENQPVHPHGHGWPVICNINEWKIK